MTTVYMLYHEYESEDGRDEVKLIGVYSSEEKARAAIELVKNQPGFMARPEGFNIYDKILDATSWKEGFVTEQPYQAV